MKILLLTRAIPYPPDSGPKIKTYHLLRYLASRHEVTLVSLSSGEQEEACREGLRELCKEIYFIQHRRRWWQKAGAVLRSVFFKLPFTIERDRNSALRQLVERLVFDAASTGKPFDLVHADQLGMSQYALPLPLPRLLDLHTVLWASYERLSGQQSLLKRPGYAREARLLKRYEALVGTEFEAITVVSEEDRQQLLAAQSVQPQPAIIPIGIDVASLQQEERVSNPQAVLSLASMESLPNLDGVLWFARTIYPLVRRAVPEVRLFICGPYTTAEVAALADTEKQIMVTGYVNDLHPYIAQAGCLIVPQRSGSGLQVKILEALARGVPVVTTSAGCKGIDLVPGQHLLVADTPSDFADAVSLLLQDPELGRQLATAGRQRIAELYDWRVVCPAIEQVYGRMLLQRGAGEQQMRAGAIKTV
jgi:polysaccharide biosynthesis protein PslH